MSLLLDEASVQELLTELGSRCETVLVCGLRANIAPDGSTAPGKFVTVFYTKGGLASALGHATAARRALMKATDFSLADDD